MVYVSTCSLDSTTTNWRSYDFCKKFNEEEAIAVTLNYLKKSLQSAGCEYEIVTVNDGSTDGTGEILRSRNDIRLIEHSRNRGYSAALKTGIRHSRYPLIVITDADGTYPNERIPELVTLATQADMVVGARIGPNIQQFGRFRSGFSSVLPSGYQDIVSQT